MTLGNMRELGVKRLIASCLNDACRHTALIDVWSYPAETEIPVRPQARGLRQVRQPGQQDRRAAQLERAAKRAEPSRQGMAVKAAR
jgi:hypothetical protein